MDDAEFDRFIARAANPALVPGIYNYCDRRCDRCRFSERCLSHLESRQAMAESAGVTSPPQDVARQPLTRALEMMRIIAERHGFSVTTTPEQQAEADAADDAAERRALADPLVMRSRQYTLTAWPITRALWPIVMARGDERIVEALETIERLATPVATKVYRAVRGAAEPDHDPTDAQSDPNGSAKIARLMVEESRRAWRVLMEVGRATADGVPAKLVDMLAEIDAGLAATFPRAMAFIRPGFDTELAAPDFETGLDPALAVLPRGQA